MSNLYHDNTITVAELTKKLASRLIDAGLRLTTAESCTGGKLSVALCAEENTADFYDVGLVVFSDSAKERILGVSPETLARFTAVSEQTVTEMAASIRDIAQADVSIAISGYAGPEGEKTARRRGPCASPGISAERRKRAGCSFPATVRTWSKKRCITRWLN